MFHGFTAEQMQLCVHLTPFFSRANLLLCRRSRFGGAASHRLFLLPAFGPLIYNVFIIVGGVIAGRQMGISSLAFGALAGSIAGPFLINAIAQPKSAPDTGLHLI